MTTISVHSLEEAIRDAGEGWLLSQYGLTTPQDALEDIRNTLQRIHVCAQQRLPTQGLDFREAAIVAEYIANPEKSKAFFQVLSGTKTPEMLLMAWRVIQGMEVHAVEISYRRQQAFHARVMLQSPYGNTTETYESTNIQDFSIFRHLGIMELNGRPVLDGFYALNLQE